MSKVNSKVAQSVKSSLVALQAQIKGMSEEDQKSLKGTLSGYKINFEERTIERKGVVKTSIMPRYVLGVLNTAVALYKAEKYEDAEWLLSVPTKADRVGGVKGVSALDLDLEAL